MESTMLRIGVYFFFLRQEVVAQTLNTWGCVFADQALLQGLLAQRLFSTTFLEGVNCFSVCERKRVKIYLNAHMIEKYST